MRLVVNRPQEQGSTGEALAPRTDAVRPALTLIQGGLTGPRRIGSTAARRRESVASSGLEPELHIEEIPIYLRPIPAWVPRLW